MRAKRMQSVRPAATPANGSRVRSCTAAGARAQKEVLELPHKYVRQQPAERAPRRLHGDAWLQPAARPNWCRDGRQRAGTAGLEDGRERGDTARTPGAQWQGETMQATHPRGHGTSGVEYRRLVVDSRGQAGRPRCCYARTCSPSTPGVHMQGQGAHR